MKIAIISDTHSLLRPEVEEKLKDCDYILHGGDIASKETFERLKEIAPAYFVRGNADKDWAKDIPVEQDIELEGYRFYMVHNIKHIREDLSGIDFVVYGHSHKYENRQKDGITYLNPGSCGPRRLTQPVTFMIMTIDDGSYSVEKVDISPILKKGTKYPPEKEMDKLIKSIIKDMESNRSVDEISKRNRVEKKLTEEILQIYITHPGIDVSGILDRLKE
ncbi:metallophosphoesterase family protein [Oribacterium sp. FC2011]|uniref:metallophosphoesterase family protein n=1 Tax=Oribacterium sp. FC2011 TaxID=1408311 RepID=UPI0009DF37B3|nr:metallophosphoesterase family protein [Oribacterium sp. FC2011]